MNLFGARILCCRTSVEGGCLSLARLMIEPALTVDLPHTNKQYVHERRNGLGKCGACHIRVTMRSWPSASCVIALWRRVYHLYIYHNFAIVSVASLQLILHNTHDNPLYMYNYVKVITYGEQVIETNSAVSLSRTYVYDLGGGNIGPATWTCPSA